MKLRMPAFILACCLVAASPGVSKIPRSNALAGTAQQEGTPLIATPASGAPAIHGPRIIGATPGRPFLFLIPATGEGTLSFSARNLPKGLTLDPHSGIISGRLARAGSTRVELSVKAAQGSSKRILTIVGGDHQLALTPPMGWNSWNVWAESVDDARVRAAADWMVKSGLVSHGFQYINIDDAWEGDRNAKGEITTNSKFPDMKALADYVHARGLRLGIYSSPGPKTCAKFEGSQGHEQQDANTYAGWGIDYLKYDWCSYKGTDIKLPYQVMRRALDKVDRDIVYSLCQYGRGNVWEWGGASDVGGNLWRTTGDITDTWLSLSYIGFNQNGHETHAAPGHWNDPDMLVVGKLGWGPKIHPTRLTPNEQITHITLWSLLSAPLLIGCDLSQIDPFTLALLTNDEVLDVDQDPLAKPAGRRWQEGTSEVWSRRLWDGTVAVGLFNRSAKEAEIPVKWADVGAAGIQPVRNLWLQRDLGAFSDTFKTSVPPHGAVLLQVGRRGAIR